VSFSSLNTERLSELSVEALSGHRGHRGTIRSRKIFAAREGVANWCYRGTQDRGKAGEKATEVIPFSVFGVTKTIILQNESLHLLENKEQAM
jgi:hypothetical protein